MCCWWAGGFGLLLLGVATPLSSRDVERDVLIADVAVSLFGGASAFDRSLTFELFENGADPVVRGWHPRVVFRDRKRRVRSTGCEAIRRNASRRELAVYRCVALCSSTGCRRGVPGVGTVHDVRPLVVGEVVVLPADGPAHDLLDEVGFPAAGAAGGQRRGGAELGCCGREDLASQPPESCCSRTASRMAVAARSV